MLLLRILISQTRSIRLRTLLTTVCLHLVSLLATLQEIVLPSLLSICSKKVSIQTINQAKARTLNYGVTDPTTCIASALPATTEVNVGLKARYTFDHIVQKVPVVGFDGPSMRANAWQIQQSLAAGAHGILICEMHSPEAGEIAISASRYKFTLPGVKEYPIEGSRGAGSQVLDRATSFRIRVGPVGGATRSTVVPPEMTTLPMVLAPALLVRMIVTSLPISDDPPDRLRSP